MRRSICYCEPKFARAAEVNTWTFVFKTAKALPKGACLRFDPLCDGREIDWQPPQIDLKKQSNVIYARLSGGKILKAKEIELETSICPVYDFILPVKVEAEGVVTIVMGSPKEDPKTFQKCGNQTQQYTQRRRSFHLFVDPSGKGRFGDPEVFTIDIKGAPLHKIRILNPSIVARNKRFDVVVRFEDEYGNLTSDAPEETLIELTHEHLRENLSWKLFVPETGFLTIPNLYFNEPGVYTLRLHNTYTNEVASSFPIKCLAENEKHLFWGLLHGESERIDSTENIESCLRHFRDERALNFFSSSPFSSLDEVSNDIWKQICQNIADFEEPDRFSTFLGFQWIGAPKKEGVRHFIYAKESKLLLRKEELKDLSLKAIYENFSPKELLSIPCFTMGRGVSYDFSQFNPNFERVVEIYNAWGCSEQEEKEGNSRPIQGLKKGGVREAAEGAIEKALQKNCRFGFVAGGLDDRGCYANFYEGGQMQYSPGLTAIIARDHSRAALFEALYNRSCYATTGERIIIGLSVATLQMGGEGKVSEKPGLAVNRHISGYIGGTDHIEKVEIIRNGKVLETIYPKDYHAEFAYDDMTAIEKNTIKPKEGPPFVYYYMRVTQKNGHMAWSSPIWVDDDRGEAIAPKKSAKETSKKSAKV